MTFKTVFFSMVLVLIALFIFSHFFRKKEKIRTKLEGDYYLALREFKKTQDPKLKQDVIDMGLKYGLVLGLDQEQAQAMVQKELEG